MDDGQKAIEQLTTQMAQMTKENEELKKLVKEHARKIELQEGRLEKLEEQKMAPFAVFARLIGVPTVVKLKGNYTRKKLLQLIQHGNAITSRLYIQNNQKLDDEGLLKSIVDLLAKAEKPEKMIREVVIERGSNSFKWPKKGQLKLKRKVPRVDVTFNEEMGKPQIPNSGKHLAEYGLTNRDCHFEVDIFYWREEFFGKLVSKFVYRRLDDLELDKSEESSSASGQEND